MEIRNIDNSFVRVVILNYNESNFTLSLVNQIRNQTFKRLEIVVVDNCSVKEEYEILKNNLPSDIIVITATENFGYAGGNNLGLKFSGDNDIDYFLVLNNDLIIVDANFIEKMLMSMFQFRKENVVACSPLIDTVSSKIDLNKQIQVRKLLSKWNTFLINIPLFKFYTDRHLRSVFLYLDQQPFMNKYLLCDSINGAAFIVDKEFIVQNNYLDEGTFLYYEEIILGKQIQNVGKTCLLNGFAVVKHLQGLSTLSSSNRLNVFMERFKYKSSLYYLQEYENLDKFSSLIYVFLSELVISLKKVKIYLYKKKLSLF